MPYEKRGNILIWALILVIPSILFFTEVFRVFILDLTTLNDFNSVRSEIINLVKSSANQNMFLNLIRNRFNSSISELRSSDKIEADIRFRGKNYTLIVSRRPVNAFIFFDVGEPAGPFKNVHLNPEVWILTNQTGFYTQFLPAISNVGLESWGHFININFAGSDSRFFGPTAFLELNQDLRPSLKQWFNSRVFSVDSLSETYRDERGNFRTRTCAVHSDPASIYCLGSLQMSSYHGCNFGHCPSQNSGQFERGQCIFNAIQACKNNSRVGLATFIGSSCYNPAVASLKLAATYLWDFFASNPSNRVAVFAGPGEREGGLVQQAIEIINGISVNRSLNVTSRASGSALQNPFDYHSNNGFIAIDQDCWVALRRDTNMWVNSTRGGTVLTANNFGGSLFIPPPISEQLGVNLGNNFVRGLRNIPRPEFDSRGRLVSSSSNLNVREAIWAQGIRRRHQNFENVVRKTIEVFQAARQQTNRSYDVEIFYILSDFPWFGITEDIRRTVDPANRVESFGFLKVERQFHRCGGERGSIRPFCMPGYNARAAEAIYFRKLDELLRELNRFFASQGLSRPANITFLILRSEGSYPSHAQAGFDCPRLTCRLFSEEAQRFQAFLRRRQQAWRHISVNFIPAPDPGSLPYEAVTAILTHFLAKSTDVSLKKKRA